MSDFERVFLGLLCVATFQRPDQYLRSRDRLDYLADEIWGHAYPGGAPKGWRYV